MASVPTDLDVNKLVRNIRLQTLGKEPELDVPTPFEKDGGLEEINDSDEDDLMQS